MATSITKTSYDKINKIIANYRPTWFKKALCSQTSSETFFPEKGGSAKAAKMICGGCDVQTNCLQYALENNIKHGIWGSKSFIDRENIRKVV